MYAGQCRHLQQFWSPRSYGRKVGEAIPIWADVYVSLMPCERRRNMKPWALDIVYASRIAVMFMMRGSSMPILVV